MPIVYFSGFISSNTVPPEIRPYVDDYQWQMIHQKVQAIEGGAHAATCCCEIVLCLLVAGPFIFLCHPFIYGCCAAARKPREMDQLNHALFNGSPVLGWSDFRYTFNTDLVQPRTQGVAYSNAYLRDNVTTIVVQPAGPPVASVSMVTPQVGGYDAGTYAQAPQATPVGGYPSYSGSAHAASVVPSSYNKVPTTSTNRQLMVQIPLNAQPGQVLTVQAPDGTLAQVHVQSHHRPGDNIVVNY